MIHFSEYNWEKLNNLTDIVKSGSKKIRYLNYPFAFDIETSSFYYNNEKRACMYIWMFSINGDVVYGRTWSEFEFFLEELRIKLKLDYYNRIIVYVHNLSYEFQFLISHVDFNEVFARKKRHPIKCLINNSFEFKCSYFLSGLSLEKTAENITITKIEKLVGFLDYRKLRHSKTVLYDNELAYCEHDLLVIHYFILEEMGKNGNDISKIPLTKTGYVRQYCRNYIKTHTNYKRYREKILNEAPIEEELFCLLNKAFQGGYTHANYKKIFSLISDVHSIDFTSSYPAQMVAHKYPRGKFIKCEIRDKEHFKEMINKYACVFEVRLTNVESKTSHHIISSSKCAYGTSEKYNAKIDNGRLVRSDEIYTFMTDVDFKNFEKFYTYDEIGVNKFYFTTYDYLPKEIIECVLKFYSDKTTLKDIAEKIAEYFVSKGMVNGIYGMMVTNPLNDEIYFEDDEWKKETPEISSALYKAYKSVNQFLCYQWGVWITAWARYELFKGIIEMGDDCIYCDTDSIKFVNLQKHEDFIVNHNKEIFNNLALALLHFDLDVDLLSPKDIKGKSHPLGVWEYEGKYDLFKTLGAKRYMVKKGENYEVTVSGMFKKRLIKKDENGNKIYDKNGNPVYDKTPLEYIIMKGNFDYFTHEMEIPAEYSKRLTHSYIPKPYRIENLKDYQGNYCTVSEYNYIHLEPSTFSMKLGDDFVKFLLGADNPEALFLREKRPELQINKLHREVR